MTRHISPAKTLARILRTVCLPIAEQPTLLLTAFLCLNPQFPRVLKVIISGGNNGFPLFEEFFAFIAFLLAYIIAASAILFRRKWYKMLWYVLLLTIFTVHYFLHFNFGSRLTPELMNVLLETNVQESTEFLQYFLPTKGTLITAALLALLISAVAIGEKYQRLLLAKLKAIIRGGRSVITGILGILTILSLIFGIYQCRLPVSLLRAKSQSQLEAIMSTFSPWASDEFTYLSCAIKGCHFMRQQSDDFTASTARALKEEIATLTAPADTLRLIMVIGESYNKRHAGIYGYSLSTTPCMQREADDSLLTVFNDVISRYSTTSITLKNIFSLNNQQAGEPWGSAPGFTAIMKQAGYGVYLWDNQVMLSGTGNSTVTSSSTPLDGPIREMCYTAVNERNFPLDGEILDDFFLHTDSVSSRYLGILHLMGQHISAKARYPHETFSRFTGDSIRRTEPWITPAMLTEIAYYDNATLYNDALMGRLFDRYRHSNAVIIYFSDHSDEIFDYRPSMGRLAPTPCMERQQIEALNEIPFVVWTSPLYKERHPEMVENIRRAASLPFTNDNVSQMLLNLGGIKSSYYSPGQDPLSGKFRPVRRIVKDNTPYDP